AERSRPTGRAGRRGRVRRPHRRGRARATSAPRLHLQRRPRRPPRPAVPHRAARPLVPPATRLGARTQFGDYLVPFSPPGDASARSSVGQGEQMEYEGLEITVDSQLDCDVVMLEGELDCQSAPMLADTLERANAAGRPIVVDLSRLEFIDSSGLHVLVSRGAKENGRPILVCPPGNVARVLSIIQAEEMVDVYEQLDEALDGVRINGRA